jgi:hypothetical protein
MKSYEYRLRRRERAMDDLSEASLWLKLPDCVTSYASALILGWLNHPSFIHRTPRVFATTALYISGLVAGHPISAHEFFYIGESGSDYGIHNCDGWRTGETSVLQTAKKLLSEMGICSPSKLRRLCLKK